MYNNKIPARPLTFSALAVAVMVAPQVQASGYKINEQSASGVGTAYAGRAAVAEDASTVFFNPAGMSKFERPELSFGTTYIDVNGRFEGERTNPAGTPGSLEGVYNDGGDFIPNPVIPFAYYVHPVDDKFALGLGVFAPFGTHTDYKSGSLLGGFADETQLTTIEFQPSFSYQLTDTFAIGGGFDILYAKGLLSKELDLIPYVPVPGHALNNDAYKGYENKFSVEGDDIAYGWNLGLMWDVSEATTFGFTYRSEVDIELEGDAEFKQKDGVMAFTDPDGTGPIPAGVYPVDGATGRVNDQAARVPLTTPRSATFSLAHKINDRLQLQGGATWTDWSVFEYFDIIATKPGLIDDLSGLGDNYIGHIVEKWQDTMAYALGATYQLNNDWILRVGYAYDESPVKEEHRTARVPDNDRQWLTAGFNYTINQDLDVDMGLAYLIIDKSELNEYNYDLNDQKKGNGLENASGEYELDALGVSLQLNYRL